MRWETARPLLVLYNGCSSQGTGNSRKTFQTENTSRRSSRVTCCWVGPKNRIRNPVQNPVALTGASPVVIIRDFSLNKSVTQLDRRLVFSVSHSVGNVFRELSVPSEQQSLYHAKESLDVSHRGPFPQYLLFCGPQSRMEKRLYDSQPLGYSQSLMETRSLRPSSDPPFGSNLLVTVPVRPFLRFSRILRCSPKSKVGTHTAMHASLHLCIALCTLSSTHRNPLCDALSCRPGAALLWRCCRGVRYVGGYPQCLWEVESRNMTLHLSART